MGFVPRVIPGGDAATFVAESLRSLPMPYAAVVDVRGPADEVRAVLRRDDADVEDLGAGRVRVRIAAGHEHALLATVTLLAAAFPVTVREPPELVELVAAVAERLGR